MYKKKRAGDPPADLDEGRKRVVLFRLTLVYNFKFRERERERGDIIYIVHVVITEYTILFHIRRRATSRKRPPARALATFSLSHLPQRAAAFATFCSTQRSAFVRKKNNVGGSFEDVSPPSRSIARRRRRRRARAAVADDPTRGRR